jgi:hypothetical protein
LCQTHCWTCPTIDLILPETGRFDTLTTFDLCTAQANQQGRTKRMQATARRLSVVSATSCARRRLIRDVLGERFPIQNPIPEAPKRFQTISEPGLRRIGNPQERPGHRPEPQPDRRKIKHGEPSTTPDAASEGRSGSENKTARSTRSPPPVGLTSVPRFPILPS